MGTFLNILFSLFLSKRKKPFPSNSANKWGHPQSSEWTTNYKTSSPPADSQWKGPPGADWSYGWCPPKNNTHWCNHECTLNIILFSISSWETAASFGYFYRLKCKNLGIRIHNAMDNGLYFKESAIPENLLLESTLLLSMLTKVKLSEPAIQ